MSCVRDELYEMFGLRFMFLRLLSLHVLLCVLYKYICIYNCF